MASITIPRPTGYVEVNENGDLEYLYQYKIHRDRGPAMIFTDGYTAWLQFNYVHRTNGPGLIWENGDKEYWVDNAEMPAEEFFLKYGVL